MHSKVGTLMDLDNVPMQNLLSLTQIQPYINFFKKLKKKKTVPDVQLACSRIFSLHFTGVGFRRFFFIFKFNCN